MRTRALLRGTTAEGKPTREKVIFRVLLDRSKSEEVDRNQGLGRGQSPGQPRHPRGTALVGLLKAVTAPKYRSHAPASHHVVLCHRISPDACPSSILGTGAFYTRAAFILLKSAQSRMK